jgi:hypothetical protein
MPTEALEIWLAAAAQASAPYMSFIIVGLSYAPIFCFLI